MPNFTGFESPWWLLLLLGVIALVVAYVLAARRRRIYAVRLTTLHLLDSVAPQRPAWRRVVPAVAFSAMATLLVLAIAKPTGEVAVPRDRATVVVALDTSASMMATDVSPTRDSAARAAAAQFVKSLPESFDVGLVVFDESARLAVPPSTDRQAVVDALASAELGPGTAIGDAVDVGVQAIADLRSRVAAMTPLVDGKPVPPAPARIVLLSDGGNTSGVELATAGSTAKTAGVPVTTIAFGTAEGTVTLDDGRVAPVPADRPALASLASATKGTSYDATTSDELNRVYEDIATAVGTRLEPRDLTVVFIGIALLLGLIAGAASVRYFARLP